MESIGSRIFERLTELSLTQKELCERTNIKKSAMSQYISDAISPPCEKLVKIAKALGVPSGWLLGDEHFSEHELHMMKVYRSHTDFREEVDRLCAVYEISDYRSKDSVKNTNEDGEETQKYSVKDSDGRVSALTDCGSIEKNKKISAQSAADIFRAAQSANGRIPPTHETMTDEKLIVLREAPETDEDL